MVKEKAAEAGAVDGTITTAGFPPSGLIYKMTNPHFPDRLKIQNQTDHINLNSELSE